jgi:hypothetical protein
LSLRTGKLTIMKKILLLVLVIGLGVVAARRLRDA